MESNLSHKRLESYSEAVANKILGGFYGQYEKIEGDQILNLCPIQQVNLFAVKELLIAWRKELQKLESPYFDYASKEVKKALKQFMNMLSRNISIERKDFEPVLKRAVFNALLLILSPYDFYCKEINKPEQSRVKLKDLKEVSKYIKVNKALFDTFLNHLEKLGKKDVFTDEAFALLNEAFENTSASPEDIDQHLAGFFEILPTDLDSFYEKGEPSKEEKDWAVAPNRTLNDELNAPVKTLNDELVGQKRETLAEAHQKIDSLKQNVTLNQKFMFINQLFNGDQEAYQNTIDFLERCNARSEALDFIASHHAHWDQHSEGYAEFMELLDKKFL